MIWNIITGLLILWLLGLTLHISAGVIHLFPLVAMLVLLANLLAASRTVV
jgi:hypothetical protein